MTVLSIVVATLLAVPAEADPKWKTPVEADAAGRRAFAESRYEAAARAFEGAYEMDPDPRLLANIGESYRRLGDCRAALGYYDRFLATPIGAAHPRIEARAKELRAKCPDAAPSPAATPGAVPRIEDSGPPVRPAPEPAPTDIESATAEPSTEAPTGRTQHEQNSPASWQLGLEGGVALGRLSRAQSTSPALRLTAGRTWWWGAFGLGAGLGGQWSSFAYDAASFAPEPYSTRAQVLEAVVELQARLRVLSWLTMRVDAGAGLAWYSGFDAWNEFAELGAAARSGVSPNLRAALGAEVAPPVNRVSLRVTALGVSWNRIAEGVDDNVNLLVLAGVGYGF